MDNREYFAVKKKLLAACVEFINSKERTILDAMASHKIALSSETKSSAGDKHETSRAMLQLEMEKAGGQLEAIHQMKTILSKISIESDSEVARLGSLILTDHMHYFLAISAGKLSVNGLDVYAVSPNSPIGKILLGRKKNETVVFKRAITVNTVY